MGRDPSRTGTGESGIIEAARVGCEFGILVEDSQLATGICYWAMRADGRAVARCWVGETHGVRACA